MTTLELAKAIDASIEQNVTGIVHLANGDKISKYDILKLIKDIWKMEDVIVNAYQSKGVYKSLKKSVKFQYEVSTYKQMLIEKSEWMIINHGLYDEIYSK